MLKGLQAAAGVAEGEILAGKYRVERLENGAPYMVMEYLEGGDLSEWVACCYRAA